MNALRWWVSCCEVPVPRWTATPVEFRHQLSELLATQYVSTMPDIERPSAWRTRPAQGLSPALPTPAPTTGRPAPLGVVDDQRRPRQQHGVHRQVGRLVTDLKSLDCTGGQGKVPLQAFDALARQDMDAFWDLITALRYS